MVVILSVAAAAMAVVEGWKRLSALPGAAGAIMSIRQQAGVLAVLVNAANGLLDALMLVRRMSASANTSTTLPTFGRREAEFS